LIGWEYMTKSAAVVPFSKGTIAYRDGMLSRLYYGTKEAGLLSVTMCGDEPNHDEFVRLFSPDKKVLQILCEVKDQGTEQEIATPVGYCWVDKSHGVDGQRAALIGFCFFKRTRQLRALGLLGIYYWVNALKIDVLHGVMLETNFPAQDYAVKLGFKMSGHVRDYHFHNGHLEGAVVVTLRARDFLPTFKSWYEQNRVAKAD
jgi:hypothetical protein